jgi:RNA polymerase sigma-70 factor (ECF subfamily)
MKDTAAQGRMDGMDPEHSDAEAVVQTRQGDTAAFDRLIERYQRRAVAVSYRLLGNLDDALEVCQDAFLRAFRSLDTLQEPARFGVWLLRIVSNLSLNHRRARRPAIPLSAEDEDGGTIEQGLAAGGGAETDTLQAAELRQAISEAVEALPPQQRLALVLFAIEAIPQKEVAEIMQCSVEMVKWNVFQARKTLKTKLAEYLVA